MYLSLKYRTISKFHGSETLSLSPKPFAVHFSQPRNFSNSRALRESFWMSNLTKDFKIHEPLSLSVILCITFRPRQRAPPTEHAESTEPDSALFGRKLGHFQGSQLSLARFPA
jgi:hypothetical protein